MATPHEVISECICVVHSLSPYPSTLPGVVLRRLNAVWPSATRPILVNIWSSPVILLWSLPATKYNRHTPVTTSGLVLAYVVFLGYNIQGQTEGEGQIQGALLLFLRSPASPSLSLFPQPLTSNLLYPLSLLPHVFSLPGLPHCLVCSQQHIRPHYHTPVALITDRIDGSKSSDTDVLYFCLMGSQIRQPHSGSLVEKIRYLVL